MGVSGLITSVTEKAKRLYQAANTRSGERLGVLADAFVSFGSERASQGAAGIAFYAMFSMFPLLAIMVALISLMVAPEQIPQMVIYLVSPVVPISPDVISENVRRLVELRGAFGAIGLVGLLWSASNVFNLLVMNINLAWDKAMYRTFLRTRLIALAFLFGLVLLMLLALLMTGVLNLFAHLSIPFLGGMAVTDSPLWLLATRVLTPLVTFLVLLLIFRFVPNTRVRLREAAWGALSVTLLWEVTSVMFRWYLNSGLSNYDVIYGSIATLAVLMVWFNINSSLLLLGAHISAAVARRAARLNPPAEAVPSKTI